MHLRRRRDKIGSRLFSSTFPENVHFEKTPNQLRGVVKIAKTLFLSLSLSLFFSNMTILKGKKRMEKVGQPNRKFQSNFWTTGSLRDFLHSLLYTLVDSSSTYFYYYKTA